MVNANNEIVALNFAGGIDFFGNSLGIGNRVENVLSALGLTLDPSSCQEPLLSFTLSVTVNGSGTVTSDPPGISCSDDCEEIYAAGTIATLTATPDAGWQFERWDGPCTTVDQNLCTVLMDNDKSITATFTTTPGTQTK